MWPFPSSSAIIFNWLYHFSLLARLLSCGTVVVAEWFFCLAFLYIHIFKHSENSCNSATSSLQNISHFHANKTATVILPTSKNFCIRTFENIPINVYFVDSRCISVHGIFLLLLLPSNSNLKFLFSVYFPAISSIFFPRQCFNSAMHAVTIND